MQYMAKAGRSFRAEKPASALAVLKSSTLLNGVSEADLVRLSEVSHLAFAEKGEVIWFHGGDLPFFGLSATGFVKMVRSNPAGQEMTMEIMGPVEGTGCPLSARAVSDSWYLKVPKKDFLTFYRESSLLKDHVISRTTKRLKQAYDLMARMARGGIDERLAAVLFVLSESYGEPEGEGFTLTIPLTRQDVAELAGTTVESVIRTFSRWQKEGILKSEGRMISVVNEKALGHFLSQE
jgi:CRP-like cAMP-binding protein